MHTIDQTNLSESILSDRISFDVKIVDEIWDTSDSNNKTYYIEAKHGDITLNFEANVNFEFDEYGNLATMRNPLSTQLVWNFEITTFAESSPDNTEIKNLEIHDGDDDDPYYLSNSETIEFIIENTTLGLGVERLLEKVIKEAYPRSFDSLEQVEDLDELCQWMRSHSDFEYIGDNLPTFEKKDSAPDAPEYWSYDDHFMIVGDNWHDADVVPRSYFE